MDKIFPMSERSERIGKIPILAEATPKLRIGICEASEASIHKLAHTSNFFVTGAKDFVLEFTIQERYPIKFMVEDL